MENLSQEKHSRSSADRISNLPDAVINHIFSFLPTLDVVGTSILSKRWKYLWTKLTTLNFIHDDEEAMEVKEFVQFVNKVLLHIDSQRLEKFHLKWCGSDEFDPVYAVMWISYAITRNVRVLLIELCFFDDSMRPLPIRLPGILFNCATLEVLEIRGGFVIQVPSVVCLPKLEILVLCDLHYESNECIWKLVCGCPVLHSFALGIDCRDPMRDVRVISSSLRHLKILGDFNYGKCEGKLEIDAPNLEYFDLDERLEECSLVKRLDSVKSVVLDLDVFPSDGNVEDDVIRGLCIDRCNSVVKLVEALNPVKLLTLRGTILTALSHATKPLAVCFERLTILNLGVERYQWSSLAAVLGRSTKLQVLNICKMGRVSIWNTHKLCWNAPTKVPECLSSCLRQVSFDGFDGLEDEMTMIKYILQHGEVLESLTLKSFASDYKEKYQLLQHVSTFLRCSRACRIHFE